MIDGQSDSLLRKITGEHVLLTGLLLISVYMFQESFSFRDPSGLFPRFITIVIIVGTLSLLLRNYLPEPLKALTEDSGNVFESQEEELEQLNQQPDNEIPTEDRAIPNADSERSEPPASTNQDDIAILSVFTNKRFKLMGLTIGYIVLSYLIGFVWATPVFMLMYSLSVRHRWYVTLVLVFVTYQLVYGFMLLLNVQLNSGVLLG